jgi:RoxA-like, cytochrome c-like
MSMTRRTRHFIWRFSDVAPLRARILFALVAAVLVRLPAPESDVQAQAPARGARSAQTAEKHPDEDAGRFGYGSTLSPLEIRGRDTWYFWTAGDQNFYRKVAIVTDGDFDLLKVIDSRRYGQRFRTLGVLTHPGCTQATRADEYGLWLDDCPADNIPDIPGKPSGVVGLRRFDNPGFDRSKWSVEQYMRHPKNVEPPYLVGVACGFCHVGFDPLHPPDDPERPTWRNLAPAIGNQYLEDAKLFGINMTPSDFRWHIANRQPAGTVDTSRFATDHINNPNAINSIFYLANRPVHEERMRDGSIRSVNHILKDGADSIGVAGASLRVYVNIGMCSDYWLTLHQAIYGMVVQKPFSIDHARQECADWRETEARMPAAAAFLKTIGPMRLKDAPGGDRYLTTDSAVLRRGKLVFAEQCARCHSSKQPPATVSDGSARIQWLRDAVLSDDFLESNFLSDDRRYPVTEIGTNVARALASNAIQGHIWDEFSSETYKSLPPAGELRGLYNPLDPGAPLNFKLPGGGRGYYRTPSLVSIWATAPYLHNNSVGVFNKDPSVNGRMVAFLDGIEKLLWPERRSGIQSIPVTTTRSRIQLFSGPEIEVPANTPINVIARVDPRALPKLGQRSVDFLSWAFGERFILGQLLSRNLAPDFIEDRGHTFGSDLADQDKRALIEFMKTF